MLRTLGVNPTEAELQDIINEVNSEGDGKLNFENFLSWFNTLFLIHVWHYVINQVRRRGLSLEGAMDCNNPRQIFMAKINGITRPSVRVQGARTAKGGGPSLAIKIT